MLVQQRPSVNLEPSALTMSVTIRPIGVGLSKSSVSAAARFRLRLRADLLC